MLKLLFYCDFIYKCNFRRKFDDTYHQNTLKCHALLLKRTKFFLSSRLCHQAHQPLLLIPPQQIQL